MGWLLGESLFSPALQNCIWENHRTSETASFEKTTPKCGCSAITHNTMFDTNSISKQHGSRGTVTAGFEHLAATELPMNSSVTWQLKPSQNHLVQQTMHNQPICNRMAEKEKNLGGCNSPVDVRTSPRSQTSPNWSDEAAKKLLLLTRNKCGKSLCLALTQPAELSASIVITLSSGKPQKYFYINIFPT